MADKIFGGLEGGSSYSRFVLIASDGSVLAVEEGLGTNYLLLGVEECQNRIHALVEKAKQKAGLPENTILAGLGLCMSGCEEEEGNRKMEKAFQERFPGLTASCIVSSDTIGSMLTVSHNGGLVLIAGTGTNALLINPDGTTARCGGWGHLIGDEAAGIWVAVKAVQTICHTEDNFIVSPYSISRLKQLILEHFKVNDKYGLLDHLYAKFNKPYFASLCEKIAKVALEEGDPLCKHIMYEAGKALGMHVAALLPKIHKDLLEKDGGLPIICVGSLYKSWDILKEGFHDAVDSKLKKFTLLRLAKSSAIGAACLGAKHTGFRLPICYKENYTVLYQFKT